MSENEQGAALSQLRLAIFPGPFNWPLWVARECAKLARETLGANGVVNEYPVFRHLANIESVYTYEGTHDIHTLVIGEAVTGFASYNPPMEDEKAEGRKQ